MFDYYFGKEKKEQIIKQIYNKYLYIQNKNIYKNIVIIPFSIFIYSNKSNIVAFNFF